VAGDAAFDWEKEFPEPMIRGGFDVVIGNPPYERIQVIQAHAPEAVEFLKKQLPLRRQRQLRHLRLLH